MSPALHSVCRNAKLDTQIATQEGEDPKFGQEYIIKPCIVKAIKSPHLGRRFMLFSIVMGGGLDRRRMFGVLAGAALSPLGISPAGAQIELRASEKNRHEFFASSLQQKQLDQQKLKAANRLVDGFWSNRLARTHITRSFFGGSQNPDEIRQRLFDMARVYIPSPQKSGEVLQRNSEQASELAKAIPQSGYGLLLDGDEQQLYLIQNIGKNKVQFVKAYPVSTSSARWSNDPDSRGTPLGLHRIAAQRKGMLGEIVSGPKTGAKKFVESLESNDFRTAAKLITAAMLIAGPTTPSTRGIYLHGTNYQNLLSRVASSGCIRMSSMDVSDLLNYIAVGKLQKDERTVIGGTPIMISAVKGPESHEPPDRGSTLPKRVMPEDSTSPETRPKETDQPPPQVPGDPQSAPTTSPQMPQRKQRPLPKRVIP